MKKDDFMNRRQFMGTVGAAGALSALGPMASSAKANPLPTIQDRPLLDRAPDGKPLKAGLVGCGGRGTGAAFDFLNAGPNLQVTALADVFEDRLTDCRNRLLNEKKQEIPDEKCFIGFDAYQRVIDSGVDVVLLATPPHFRPDHFAACVQARKHVFMEKPVAVDPVGARYIMTTARKADAIGLCVVTGTQRRHQREYMAAYKQIRDGAIGDIVSANCYWNQDQLWYRVREEGWSDMEAMVRDWVNWCWLSGDHIVEQHVHNLDVINWFTGMHPVKAVGFGARTRRVTGDQFDFFSVDYEYENGMHLHSMCRQISGCVNNVSEFIVGTRGISNCRSWIKKSNGSLAWQYSHKREEMSPYVQEHVDLVTAIRKNQPINEAETTAISTMVAIMGRISAYTGMEVTWDQVMGSALRLGPEEYRMGPVDMKPVIPVPGRG